MLFDTRKRHPQLFEAKLFKKSKVSAIYSSIKGIWRDLRMTMPLITLGLSKVIGELQVFDLKI